jgi:hypothetical protein
LWFGSNLVFLSRLVMTSEYVESAVLYTDGSFIEGNAGFAIHRTGKGGCGFKLLSPAGVFSAKLSTLFMALRHIRMVIQPPKKCFILTDSLSSIKAMLSRRISWRTHPLVYDLMRDLTLWGIWPYEGFDWSETYVDSVPCGVGR